MSGFGSVRLFGSIRLRSVRFRLGSVRFVFGSARLVSVPLGLVWFGSVLFGAVLVRFGSVRVGQFGPARFDSGSSRFGLIRFCSGSGFGSGLSSGVPEFQFWFRFGSVRFGLLSVIELPIPGPAMPHKGAFV